jgi:mutual gliding-motility protein MglA
MPFVNYITREVHYRIVYVGPNGVGKRSTFLELSKRCSQLSKAPFSLESIQHRLSPEEPCEIVELRLRSTVPHDANLPFAGKPAHLLLWTQCYPDNYHGNRKLLGHPDGIVFVLDSRPARQAHNQHSLTTAGFDCRAPLATVPHFFQYNHRDANDALPIDRLNDAFNPTRQGFHESIAIGGEGVCESLHALWLAMLSAEPTVA